MDENDVDPGAKISIVLNKQERDREKSAYIYQFLMCALVNITVVGPSMGFGYSAVALPTMRSNTTAGLYVDEQQASWIASALAIGTPVGCIISSFVLRRGRKPSLLTTSSVSLVGWLTIYFSKTFEQIIVGRVLSGIAMGLASVPATVYSAEVTSPKLRSTTLTWTSISIACGVLIVYIFGYIYPDDWNSVALLCAVFPLIAIVLTVILVPESPMWLKDHGRCDEAVKVLKKFNGLSKNNPLSPELEAQIKPTAYRMTKKENYWKKFKSRKAVEPLIIMLVYFFFQQFSGIFAIVYYAVDVTCDAGLTINGYLGAILIGITRLCGALLVASISDKFGRRLPSIASGAGMSVFMAILSGYLFIKSRDIYLINDGGLIPAVCIIMYIFFSTFGFLTVPFAMIGEIYPASVKDTFSGITTCLAYTFSFITVKIYPDMVNAMGKHGVFLFYAILSCIGTVFVIIYLPETKGKSLLEIEQIFNKKKSYKNDILANIGNHKSVSIPLEDISAASENLVS